MRVHSLESLAALDGKGLRYGVFLAGCGLRCVYCHNPDTWSADAGTDMSPAELLSKIVRYKPYFRTDGGVTFSGGEPLLQADELCKLAELLKTEGIGYAVDTSGAVGLTDSVKRLLCGAQSVICDLKFPDAESFGRYTCGDFALVEGFLAFLSENDVPTWLRTVIVPGINDTEEWMERYAKTAKRLIPNAERYELLGFHTMGFFKYERLGIENPLASVGSLDKERLTELQSYINTLLK